MSRASPGRLHAVVLAGGAGQRFWPRSRRVRPKPLLRVVGGHSLLEATLRRARRFAPPDRTWLVCAAEHARAMRASSRLPRGHVLVEPEGRNTAMAVVWAAARLRARDPDAVMAVLPADHHVPDEAAFARAVRRAARAADRARVLVTLGVRPTRPETGYGYIRVGAPAPAGFSGLHRVGRFVEKPSEGRARRFLRHGGFLWNAGVFVWRADVILEEAERCAPELARAAAPLVRAPRASAAREAAYRRAPSLPIDVAVLERSRRVWTLPVRFGWSDVGTWASLAEQLGRGADRNVAIDGGAICEDARGNLVWPGRRTVALLGVEGLAVVDSDDALLVARLDRSGDVRRVVARLRALGREDLL